MTVYMEPYLQAEISVKKPHAGCVCSHLLSAAPAGMQMQALRLWRALTVQGFSHSLTMDAIIHMVHQHFRPPSFTIDQRLSHAAQSASLAAFLTATVLLQRSSRCASFQVQLSEDPARSACATTGQ